MRYVTCFYAHYPTSDHLCQVQEEIERLAGEGTKVTKLSVVGYSLGGLVGRYLLGVLHQRDLFKTITPVNFFTVATPHLGIINYPTFRSRMFAFFGQNLLSRTGEQFYSIDKWSAKGRPLLEVMADPRTSIDSQNEARAKRPLQNAFSTRRWRCSRIFAFTRMLSMMSLYHTSPLPWN